MSSSFSSPAMMVGHIFRQADTAEFHVVRVAPGFVQVGIDHGGNDFNHFDRGAFELLPQRQRIGMDRGFGGVVKPGYSASA